VAIKTDFETFYWLVTGGLAPADAVESGRVTVEGGAGALERVVSVLNVAPRMPAAPPVAV
jgi:hypothetical protein